MKNSNTIFKNDNLEIFWQVGSTPMNGEKKGVKINCKAVNPHDGKEYVKYAGWIGLSLALHAGANTPAYINDAAIDLIQKHKEEILSAIIDFLEINGEQYRAKEFHQANGISAGNGVNFKTSYPSNESQRQNVRSMMQKKAPKGTNHL